MKDNGTFTVKITESIAGMNKNEWDSVYPPVPESFNFYKTIDETLSDQFKTCYIAIYEKSELVTVAPCFVVDYSFDTTIRGPLKRFFMKAGGLLSKLLTFRIVMCGSPLGEGHIGLKEPLRPHVIETLSDALDTIADKEGARLIVFKQFTEEYTRALKALLSIGYHKAESYPKSRMDIWFESFDEYLRSLSKATRKDLKRKFKRIESANINLEITKDIGGLEQKIYELYLNASEKHSDSGFERLTPDFFKKLSKNMPEEARYFLWRMDNEIVAFDLCLASNGVLLDEYVGFDYSVAYKYHLWFATIRDILLWCTKNGIKAYETGTLTYEPKKRLDFKFVRQYDYIRHKNFLLNSIVGLVCMIIRPKNYDSTLKRL